MATEIKPTNSYKVCFEEIIDLLREDFAEPLAVVSKALNADELEYEFYDLEIEDGKLKFKVRIKTMGALVYYSRWPVLTRMPND